MYTNLTMITILDHSLMGHFLKQSSHPAAHLFEVSDEPSFCEALNSLTSGSSVKRCLLDLYAVTFYQRLQKSYSYENDTLFVSMFLVNGIADSLETETAMELEVPMSHIRLYWRNYREPSRVVFLMEIGADHFVAVELDIVAKIATVYDPIGLCPIDCARKLTSLLEKMLDSVFSFIGNLDCVVLYGKCPQVSRVSNSGLCSIHIFCQLLHRKPLGPVDEEAIRSNLEHEAILFYKEYRALVDIAQEHYSGFLEFEDKLFASAIILGGPRPKPSRRWRIWRRVKRKCGCGSATDFAN